jgi:hypothetical protein
MRKTVSNEESAGIGLAFSGVAMIASLVFQHFNRAALTAFEETTALSVATASALGFSASFLSVVMINGDRDLGASPVKSKYIGSALASIATLSAATGIMTYPDFKADETIRQNYPSISPSSLIEVKLPRSQTGLKSAENFVCKPFAKEFAYKSDRFSGDDGRGGVLLYQNDDFYRVNCRPYIRDHEHEFPKPDK